MPDDAEPDVVDVVPTQAPGRVIRTALIAAIALAGLVGWLGFRTYQAERQEAQRSLVVQTAQDVANGAFADSFAQHKPTYVDNAKQAQTRSLGTVTDAGLESQSGDQGRVLVAVTVTSTAAQTLDKIGARWLISGFDQK